jgi:hypothetical protein
MATREQRELMIWVALVLAVCALVSLLLLIKPRR